DAEFRNFVVGKHELYPIPRRDIDLNPNLTQNPGY
ncbi:MAG: RagB/SusD family nutrient uptake outer membrane protein, partial [Flavisolibacter sp.]|nr:RagB/SusD family nutrient uptake outer membrane protein [Flavisolibacter sp.]